MRTYSHGMSSLTLAITLAVAAIQLGCDAITRAREGGTGSLPKPPASEVTPSDYRPEQAYVALAPGLLTRTVFGADSGAGYRVEVRDLLVAPRQRTSPASLPGAAVLEVRSGAGTVTAGGKALQIRVGTTFALQEGETISIVNEGEMPITIRAHVLVGQ